MEFSAEDLRLRREKAGLSQAEMADRLGISMRQYQKYEAGTVVPKLSHIKAIDSSLSKKDEFNSHKNSEQDIEKETLRDLVETQKRLIRYQSEFITAQLIRNEAFESVILSKLTEMELSIVPRKKTGNNPELVTALDEAEQAVTEKIADIKRQLGLSS